MSRGRSVTDNSTARPNGKIAGTPPTLHRPVSMTYEGRSNYQLNDVPPPKPPRTGSTSPSAFLSLERGEVLQWEETKEGEEEEEWEEQGMDGGEWGSGEEEVWQEDVKTNGRHDEDGYRGDRTREILTYTILQCWCFIS